MISQESESESSIITGWEEKPHLQKAILHNGRVEKGPVKNRDKKGYGRHHVLRKGCTVQEVKMKVVKATSRPQESLYRKGRVRPSEIGRLDGIRDQIRSPMQ